MADDSVLIQSSKDLTADEQQDVVKRLVDCARRSSDRYKKEYDRMKKARTLYASAEKWDEKERGEGRAKTRISGLKKYKNAICNCYSSYPYEVTLAGDNDGVASDALTETLAESNADSIFSECIGDMGIMGRSYAYATTEVVAAPDGEKVAKLKVNRAYDPTTVIFDPESKRQDGSDALFVAFVDSVSIEEAMRKAPGSSKESLLRSSTWALGNYWNSTLVSVNDVVFFERDADNGCVNFYRIIGDTVYNHGTFANVSAIPAVCFLGDEIWDGDGCMHEGFITGGVCDLIQIINYCYAQLKERLAVPSTPYDYISSESTEGFIEDYSIGASASTPYRRYHAIDRNSGQALGVPTHVTPQVQAGDLIQIIVASKAEISDMIGVPESGLNFQGGDQQKTAYEVLMRSQNSVNNISHYYAHARQSITQLAKVMTEIICDSSGVANNFRVSVEKGPEVILQKERLRQQLMATQALVPDTAKPLVMAEIVRTLDIPDADALADVILQTLPEEIRPKAGGMQAVVNELVQTKQQAAAAIQQLQQLQQTNADLQRKVDTDEVAAQNQLLMTREQNANTLRIKLLDLEQRQREFEQTLLLETAKADDKHKEMLITAAQTQREADTKARNDLIKQINEADRIRNEQALKVAQFVRDRSGDFLSATGNPVQLNNQGREVNGYAVQ